MKIHVEMEKPFVNGKSYCIMKFPITKSVFLFRNQTLHLSQSLYFSYVPFSRILLFPHTKGPTDISKTVFQITPQPLPIHLSISSETSSVISRILATIQKSNQINQTNEYGTEYMNMQSQK